MIICNTTMQDLEYLIDSLLSTVTFNQNGEQKNAIYRMYLPNVPTEGIYSNVSYHFSMMWMNGWQTSYFMSQSAYSLSKYKVLDVLS